METREALRVLRRLALALSPAERDAARLEAADVLARAGWEQSARAIRHNVKKESAA